MKSADVSRYYWSKVVMAAWKSQNNSFSLVHHRTEEINKNTTVLVVVDVLSPKNKCNNKMFLQNNTIQINVCQIIKIFSRPTPIGGP